MRVVRGVVNAVLMATLIKPVARLLVNRWRKRVQESPAATIGIPVQELLEAALIEELTMPVAEAEVTSAEILEEEAGRSVVRLLLLAGLLIAVGTATAYAVAGLIERRRAAQQEEAELVAIPIEADSPEAAEEIAEEAFAE